MVSPTPHDAASADASATLLGVSITPPNPEILVAVESALAEVPVTEDWDPGTSAAG